SEEVIWNGNAHSATNHNGGAIHLGPHGKLYIATGDNANGDNSPSLTSLPRQIPPPNPHATIPTHNPFVDQTTGANQAIWALGLRNPFTFTFEQGTTEQGTTRMFINDVGQQTWEEINVGLAGSNYGWPNTEGNTGNPPSGPGTYRGPLYT